MSLFGGAVTESATESAQRAVGDTPVTAKEPAKIEKHALAPKIQVLNVYVTRKTDLSILVDGSTRFHVSRMHMCLASPVWNAMLDPNGRFLENKKGEDVTFEDDAVEPFQLVLDIVHINFGRLPSRISSSQLYELAQFSDKYDVAQTVEAFLPQWIQAKPDLLHSMPSGRRLEVIWVLGYAKLDPELLCFVTSFDEHVKSEKRKRYDVALTTPELEPLPPGLENVATISKRAQWEEGEWESQKHERILALVTERLKLLLKEKTCQSADSDFHDRCNTLLVSEAFKKLTSKFGFHIFAPCFTTWFHEKSTEEIVELLEVLRQVRTINHSAHAKCNGWVERVLKDVKAIANGPADAELRLREELLAKLKARGGR